MIINMNQSKFKIILFSLLVILFIPFCVTAEDIKFHVRTSIANAQFWQRFCYTDNETTIDNDMKIFSNNLMGNFGIGMEWILFDVGKKRGSRMFIKSGIDFIFTMSPTYVGKTNGYSTWDETAKDGMKNLGLAGDINYLGFDMDLFFGGTFPKTDLIWSFGAIFNFVFPVYSENVPISSLKSYERFRFFATPCISIGYDIHIPNTNFKITPQIRTGITCLPVIPHSLINNIDD
ncbi:MAG: hypothetical protein MJB14_22400, partial [Spirochaetes bacterium]|nr:hypothetical protein [Spirochaetota bacterium]